MNIARPSSLLACLLVSLLLSACGGGGGGDNGGGNAGGGGGGGGGANPPPVEDDPLGPVGTLEEEQDRLFMSIGLDVIQPGYSAMKGGMDAMEDAAVAFCADPAAGDLDATREAWRGAMGTWQVMEIVRFGPVEEASRRQRIQFFPDNNDAVINNVGQLLDGTQTIDEALVAGSPVGAQGLPALEYLLFEVLGFDDPVAGARRCELLVAVAQNLATLADELATAWGLSGQLLADFTSASGAFTDRTEVLTEILEAMALQTEFVADEKITRPLAVGVGATESFRSENSKQNLDANAAALRQWMDLEGEETDYALRAYLTRAHDADAIQLQLDSQLAQVEGALASIDASLEALILGEASGDIDTVRSAMQDLADSFIDAAIASDVNLGFNNQDGD